MLIVTKWIKPKFENMNAQQYTGVVGLEIFRKYFRSLWIEKD